MKDLNAPQFLLVLTTEKDYTHARNLARDLLLKKLAACINLRELKSLFWWEGEIEENKEVQLIIKTSQCKLSELLSEIKKIHTYNVPEILFFPVNSEENYETWIKEVLEY